MPESTQMNDEMVAIPKAALDWLFGEGPDQNGNWFERGDEDVGTFWWRKKFRAMLRLASTNSEERGVVTDEMVCIATNAWHEAIISAPGGEPVTERRKRCVRAALEAALSPAPKPVEAGEPVAWRYKHPNEDLWSFTEWHPVFQPTDQPTHVEPLYTHPAPVSKEIEEARAEIKRLQCALVRYGNRQSMSMAPPDLQQSIDAAFEARAFIKEGGNNG